MCGPNFYSEDCSYKGPGESLKLFPALMDPKVYVG